MEVVMVSEVEKGKDGLNLAECWVRYAWLCVVEVSDLTSMLGYNKMIKSINFESPFLTSTTRFCYAKAIIA